MRNFNGQGSPGRCGDCGEVGPLCGNDSLCANCDHCPNCACGAPTHHKNEPAPGKSCGDTTGHFSHPNHCMRCCPKYKEEKEEMATTTMKLAKAQWDLFEKAVATGRHVLAHGRPGTGKSRYAFDTAKATQRRLDVINIRPNLPVDPLVGHYIPNKHGYFTWMYGVISASMKEGGLVLVNEIDHAQGDAESIMHFALDDPSVASVTLPNEEREIIRPMEGYQVIATMNGVAQQDLSGPIYSRFSCKIRIDFPNPKALESLDKDLHKVAMTDYRGVQVGRTVPDLRMLYAFQDLRKKVGDKDAAMMVFEAQGTEFLATIAMAA